MELFEFLAETKSEIADLKNLILQMSKVSVVSEKWIPRKNSMEYLNYGPTQMAAFEKENEIVISRIGKRKFYSCDSIEKLLNKNSNSLKQGFNR